MAVGLDPFPSTPGWLTTIWFSDPEQLEVGLRICPEIGLGQLQILLGGEVRPKVGFGLLQVLL